MSKSVNEGLERIGLGSADDGELWATYVCESGGISVLFGLALLIAGTNECAVLVSMRDLWSDREGSVTKQVRSSGT